MTDRSPPDTETGPPDQISAAHEEASPLVLAYVDGTLDAHLRAEFETRMRGDPALLAEVEGLQAVRGFLDQDARFGRDELLDVPPPHLLEAILHAETIARPNEIRQAVALFRRVRHSVAASPAEPQATPETARPLWARLSSWLVGGGVLVGAAAAVLLVVNQGNADLVPPSASSHLQPTTFAAAPTLPPPAPVPPSRSAQIADAPIADAKIADAARREGEAAGGKADRLIVPAASEEVAKPKEELAKPKKAEAPGARPDAKAPLHASAAEGARAETEATSPAPSPLPPAGPLAPSKEPGPKDAAPPPPKAAPASAHDDSDAAPKAVARPTDGALAQRGPPAAVPAAAATAPPVPAVVAPPASPPTSVSGGGSYRSADDSTRSFLEQMKSRKQAQIDKEKAEAKKKAASSMAPKGNSSEPLLTPTEARDDLERRKRLDQASELVTTAERELAAGRALEAADLAGRAEALGGSAVGLVPASTQTRAFLLAKRFGDAARVGSRLLQANAADPVLVDGMLAGADAALAIGDRRLAERLLVHALAPANKDAARRGQAQRRLDGLKATALRDRAAAEATAPAKAAAAAASVDAEQ